MTQKHKKSARKRAGPPEHLLWSVYGRLCSDMAQAACHFLWDSKGLRTFSLPSLTTQPNLILWQTKTEGVAALHLGRPNASSEALDRGTYFSTQVLL